MDQSPLLGPNPCPELGTSGGIGGYVSGEGPRSSEGTQNWLSVTPPGPQGDAARSAVGLLTDWELVPQVEWASIYSGEGI